jgi:hypothetical protein
MAAVADHSLSLSGSCNEGRLWHIAGDVLASLKVRSGIVDQDIEPTHGGLHRGGKAKAPPRATRGRGKESKAAVPPLPSISATTRAPLSGIAAMHQHLRAGAPEFASDEPADPVCRTGDQCRLSGQVFHPSLLMWLDKRD